MAGTAGYVYVIGVEGSTLVKIGKTTGAPEPRMKQLQTGLPYRLKLLKVYSCEDPKTIEWHMHALLKEQCHAREWFDLDVQGLDAVFQQASTLPAPVPLKKATGGLGTLGQAIKKARIDRRMPQKELRELVGVSQKQMSAIELDKVDPRWSTVVKIARALRVPLDELAKSNGESHG